MLHRSEALREPHPSARRLARSRFSVGGFLFLSGHLSNFEQVLLENAVAGVDDCRRVDGSRSAVSERRGENEGKTTQGRTHATLAARARASGRARAPGSAQSALAWKPFTHVYTGDKAWTDVTADGKVAVNGHEYAVDPTIVTALQNERAYFNAGVIGPDGFPDLVMGQSVIHPEKTGEWLRYIMRKAWEAQTASAYNAAERRADHRLRVRLHDARRR